MILFLIFLDYCPNYKLKKKENTITKDTLVYKSRGRMGPKVTSKTSLKKKIFFKTKRIFNLQKYFTGFSLLFGHTVRPMRS